MTRNELINLKKLLEEEILKQERINELIYDEKVMEFLILTNNKKVYPIYIDRWNIIKKILENFQIKKTNGIYVCTGTYFTDYNISYQETEYYTRAVAFNSNLAEYRIYQDIENQTIKKAYIQEEMLKEENKLTTTFERENIVLNPYNSSNNKNGYEEVRKEFFINSIEQGQAKAKKLILDKFQKI